MTHPRLRDDVLLLVGMDDQPLAYDGGTGRYHRLSAAAAATLRMLDGTRSADEVADALATARRQENETVRGELFAFLAQLGRAGLLAGTSPPIVPPPRRSLLLPRFVVTRRLPELLEPIARRLRTPRRATIATRTLAGAGVLGTIAGVIGFGSTTHLGVWGTAGAVAAVLLVLQICLHESAHALVAQTLGVPIRAAGFALLLWLLPVAYVDRTDAYRVRRRGGRVALALAGPLCDGVCMGITAAVALLGHGFAADVAAHLLVFDMFTLFLNVNPLLPSDGYVALEAAFGLVDPRGRAFTMLTHAVRRKPLPPHLATLTRGARRALLGYGLACAAYLAMIVYFAVTALVGIVVHALAALLG